ncbi:MAG: flagellar motor protein MotA [Alphaproteobacteria bacterium]|nr:MAG: flagellar motor protein MotA [Alphaproteobacteria bacterium]
MTGTGRFLGRVALFLAAVIAGVVVSHGLLLQAFEANPSLNGMILAVMLLGVGFIIRQMLVLNPEVRWVEAFQRGQPPPSGSVRLLAPMVSMIGNRQGRLALSPTSMRSLLDSIGARLDEARDIARYLIGLLILLGLLGTFFGLMQTVGSVGDVVGRLTMGGGDTTAAFEDLKQGLATPLSAMGTAFSSSLFGLAGSLILGFLDLQAGQAQNRFYNELEEYLSSQTRLGSAGPVGDGEASVPAYIQALLEQTADSLESLTRTMGRGEEGRAQTNQNLNQLVDRLAQLSELMRGQAQMLERLGDAQLDIRPTLQRLGEHLSRSNAGLDDGLRTHLRSIDLTLQRLVEDQARGRQEVVSEVRAEIRLLTKTIVSISDQQDT